MSPAPRCRPQHWPIAVRLVDLASLPRGIDDVTDYPRTRVVVQDAGVLVGSVDIENKRAPVSETRLRDAIAAGLAGPLMRRALARQLQHEKSAPLSPQVAVSIVIPTCGRPADLRRCLESLRSLVIARPIEVIVIDNRPGGTATPTVTRDFPGLVLVEEARPGLSYARNAGFAAATGDILVAIDDDVTVTPDWLERLVAPFARPEVMGVTGNVLPAELETEAQCRFEAYGGLGKGFTRREVNGEWFASRSGAVPTWELGATANAAFRASICADPAIGLLDEALGAGMPTGCSEDTYLFYRILKAGHTLVYEPAAWVWHHHRREMPALGQQIYAYSKGHVAYHLTTLMRDGDRRALKRLAWSLPKAHVRRVYARLRGQSDYPIRSILTEIAGNLVGPFALWQSRRRVRRLGRSGPYNNPPDRLVAASSETASTRAVSMERSGVL